MRQPGWQERWTEEGDRLLRVAMGVVAPPPGADALWRGETVAHHLMALERLALERRRGRRGKGKGRRSGRRP